MRNEGRGRGRREGKGARERERERVRGDEETEEGRREQGRVPVPPELINRCPLRPPSRTPTMPSSGVHQ